MTTHYDLTSVNQSMTRGIDRYGNVETLDDDQAFLLTPEALMTYCEGQLRTIDGQVHQTFAQQVTAQHELQSIGNVYDIVGGLSDETTDQGLIDNLDKAIPRAVNELMATDPALAAKLNDWYTNVLHAGNDATLGKAEINKLQTILTDGKDAIGKQAELNMVQLQSLMSQRQSALQVCTNLVQALGDTTKQIAGNVGK